jgi:anti-sigma factor RsiW
VTGHPQDDLPGLLLGELPPATTIAVDRHLAGCDPCRRDLAAVAVASSALRDLSRLPFPEAPYLPPLRLPATGPAADDDRAGRAAPALGGRTRGSRWLLGAAAVLLALLVGVGGFALGRGRDDAGPAVALDATAGSATAEARMRGSGDGQIMTMTAKGLPRPPAGAWYEVWLVDDAGNEFPVGVLAANGEGIWSLPADVAARYRVIDVTLEVADDNPSRSSRTVLRGAYA